MLNRLLRVQQSDDFGDLSLSVTRNLTLNLRIDMVHCGLTNYP